MKVEKISLESEVQLTAKELQQKGQEMAAAILKYDDYETEKKAIVKDLGDKMKELHAQLSVLAKVTKRKHEFRQVECQVELNMPADGTKRITRLDTKEIIKELPMTTSEKQSNLFGDSIEELNKMFNIPTPPEPPPEQPAA
jgi:hypothetical protein